MLSSELQLLIARLIIIGDPISDRRPISDRLADYFNDLEGRFL